MLMFRDLAPPLRLALIATVAVVALAACGDSDETTSGAGTTATTAATSETTAGTDEPVDMGPYPIAHLEVTIDHPDQETYTYTVTCLDDTATVEPADVGVEGDPACLALADEAVQQRLIEGAPADAICTEIYGGPDVATITGDIDGTAVDTTVDRANGCGIDDWDSLLVGLLPPAVGAAGY
jgi:hypothetical protein